MLEAQLEEVSESIGQTSRTTNNISLGLGLLVGWYRTFGANLHREIKEYHAAD